MASGAGTTRRDDGSAARLTVVRPPSEREQLACVLAELLTWLRERNPQPAAPDAMELLHTRFLNLDPPLSPAEAIEQADAALGRLRKRAGRMQLQELREVGLTVRLDGKRLLVSPSTLVTEELRQRIERGRELLLLALHDSELGQ